MSTTLTETPSFDETITVPEGLDSFDNSAEVVEAIAQALANRTRFLKLIADNAARVDIANAFVGGDVFNDTITVSPLGAARPLLGTGITGADVTDHPSKWKLIFSFKANGGTPHYVLVYTGTNPAATPGGFLVAYNAVWDAAAGTWSQQDHAKASCAWIVNFGFVQVSAVSAQGASPASWADWPAGDASDRGDLYVGRDLYAGRNLIALTSKADAFEYPAPVRRSTLINIASCYGSVFRNANGSVTYLAGPTASWPAWPIVLPTGAKIIGATVLAKLHDAGQRPVFKFCARPAVNPLTAGATAIFNRDTQTAPDPGGSYPAMSITTLDPSAGGGGYFVDPETEEYQIVFEFSAGGSLTAPLDEVHSIRVDWDDYGPGIQP